MEFDTIGSDELPNREFVGQCLFQSSVASCEVSLSCAEMLSPAPRVGSLDLPTRTREGGMA